MTQPTNGSQRPTAVDIFPDGLAIHAGAQQIRLNANATEDLALSLMGWLMHRLLARSRVPRLHHPSSSPFNRRSP